MPAGNQQPKVAVIGSLAFDTNRRAGVTHRMFGGAVTYSGLTLARLGADVTVIIALDKRDCGPIKSETAVIRTPSPTYTCFENVEGEDGSRNQVVTQLATPVPASAVSLLQNFEWIHLGPLHPFDLDLMLIENAAKLDAQISIDIQGYTRAINADGTVEESFFTSVLPLLHFVNWIKADKKEAELLAEAACCRVNELVSKFDLNGMVITDSVRGGTYYIQNDISAYEAIRPDVINFETGAGDVFFGAFIASELALIDLDQCPAIAGRHVAGQWITPAELKRI